MADIALAGWAGHTALTNLFNAYRQCVIRSLRHRGVDPQDLEDVSHDLWIEIAGAAKRFRGDAPVRHFLYRLMRDAAARYHRERNREAPFESLDMEEEAESHATTTMQSSNQSGWRDFGDCVRQAFADFEDKHPRLARLLLLRHVEERSLAEMAEEFDSTAPRIRDRLFSARRKFAPSAQPCLSLWPARRSTT